MPKKASDISKALKKKGFIEDVSRDHKWYVYYHNGKKTSINTKISHSADDIGDGLLGKMSRQVHLSRKEFDEYIACHISQEEYDCKMIKNGHVQEV